MKQYEVAVLLHPDLEIDLKPPLERLEGAFKQVGAKVVKKDEWGKRKLAYPIKSQTFAVYYFFVIDLDPVKAEELEQALRLNDEVLRHMVVLYEAPIEDDSEEDTSKDKEEKQESKEEKDGS